MTPGSLFPDPTGLDNLQLSRPAGCQKTSRLSKQLTWYSCCWFSLLREVKVARRPQSISCSGDLEERKSFPAPYLNLLLPE